MSRAVTGTYDEDFPNQAEFWLANARRALSGRRGKKALAELREALLHLPEKRLVQGTLSTASLKAYAEELPEKCQSWAVDGKPYTVPNWIRESALEAVAKEGIGVCAVGAYCWWKAVQAGADPEAAMADLPVTSDALEHDLWNTVSAGKRAGLVSYVAWTLADLNDETFRSCTPEERYEKVLAWVDKELTA